MHMCDVGVKACPAVHRGQYGGGDLFWLGLRRKLYYEVCAYAWKKQEWSRGDLKNMDLIKPAFRVYRQLVQRVKVRYVPGHTGMVGSELADRMAIYAVKRRESGVRHFLGSIDDALAMKRG